MVFRKILPVLLLFALFPALISAQQNVVPARITQAIDNSKLTVLKGNTHFLAVPGFDRGPAPSNLPLNRMLLVLQRSAGQEAALEALIDQQQDKTSPNYHAWLTPDQFGQQFGPADQDIQTITAWLESHGFQISRVAKGRIVIEFSGTALQVKDAFHTEIHKYTVDGKDHWANSADPQIPTALTPVVAGVESLNNFPRHAMSHSAGIFTRSKDTGKVTPVGAPVPQFTFQCGSTGTGAAIDCYPLGPYDFGTIYNVTPLWTAGINGTGQRIGIVAETDINPQDFADFHTIFGQTNPVPVLNIIHDGPDPGVIGDEPEGDIDTQWSSAVAPGATIDFVVSQPTETTTGVDLSAEYIVDNNLDPVMSESYGFCELGLGTAGNAYFNQLWQQATAQGITVLVASGDAGSAVCDQGQHAAQYGLAVSGYGSTPYNVAVGGTDFNDLGNFSTYWNATNDSITQASAKSYIPEMTWNDSCTNQEVVSLLKFSTAEQLCNSPDATNYNLLVVAGGSGGASNCTSSTGQSQSSCSGGYAKPSWQKGTGVPSDGKRDVPDVSLLASNGFNGSFYIVCERDAVPSNSCDLNPPYFDFAGYGGTSVSSPAFAGIMALVNQKYGRQGNANYVLYALAMQSGVFHDVPAGSTIAMPCVRTSPNCNATSDMDTYGVLSGYSTTAGYDLATGLGSVNAANLVNSWSSVHRTSSTTTLTLNGGSAVNITHGASVNVAVAVSPNSPQPTGDVSLIASPSGSSDGFAIFTLSNGVASGTTNMLPGGTSYTVNAHYEGDTTYASSDSNGVTVTVSPEASKTALSIVTFDPATGAITNSNATSFPYGSPYLLRTDITNSSGTTCFSSTTHKQVYGCPTGSVNLTDNGTALGSGSFALNSEGFAEYQAIQLTGGSHPLSGSYTGDNSYNSSTGSDTITVTPAPTTTSITSPATSTPPQTTLIGAPSYISVRTQSNSSGVAPTANQQSYLVFDGTTQLTDTLGFATGSNGSPTAGAWVGASLQTTISAPSGPHSLTVKYSGDTNYANSTSTAVTVDAVYNDTVALTANPSNVIYGQNTSVTVTATLGTTNPASNAALKPTGAISFTIPGTANTTVSQDASGNWMMQSTISTVPQQSEQVTATYPGDSNYASSGQSVVINVTIPDFTLSTPSPLTFTAGQTGTATITITPTTNYTSTVSLSCSGSVLYNETCSISPSSVTLSNGAATTATLSINTPAPSGATSALVAPVRMRVPIGPRDRSLWWALSALAALISLLLLLFPPRVRFAHAAAGFALVSVLAFVVGCGGGGGGSGGGGGGSSPQSTTTTISVPNTKFAMSSGVTLTATVKSSASAAGIVTFSSLACNYSNNTLLTNGTAQTVFSPFMPGTCALIAQYAGDVNNLGSQSGSLSVTATGNVVQGVTAVTGTDTHMTSVNVTVQ